MTALSRTHETIRVELGARSYPISIGAGMIDELPDILQRVVGEGSVGVVTDTNVSPLFSQHAYPLLKQKAFRHVVVAEMPAGEKHKNLEAAESLIGQFVDAGLDRSSVLVAFGGGVVGDVAGFVAATYMRGIPYVQVPTTIVAQVDSSVGGKTAVNHSLGKNIIGAFHQPSAVVIDTSLLKTLPDREVRAGIAEVIKHGVIADEALFAYLEDHGGEILQKDVAALLYPIRRSCEIKASIVSADEREQGVRANLNYGHTFGHAIEAVTEYGTFLHGEAVALGMCAAANLARRLDLVDPDFVVRQTACIARYGLPVCWPEIPVDATLDAMRRDKKARGGTVKFVLPDRLGHVIHRTDVPWEDVRAAVNSLTQRAGG